MIWRGRSLSAPPALWMLWALSTYAGATVACESAPRLSSPTPSMGQSMPADRPAHTSAGTCASPAQLRALQENITADFTDYDLMAGQVEAFEDLIRALAP